MPTTLLFDDFCPSCGSLNTIEHSEPPNSTHHARLNCGDCKRFIKWLPKPKPTNISISRLLQNSHLEPWERKFLKTVAYHQPTQSETIVLEAIQAKLEPACYDAG